ncbi:hypothetical protein BX616_005998 [Lobosporangium transversale]|nr:hypothetical protein BX616_005998 [Lobosporangium transversale]
MTDEISLVCILDGASTTFEVDINPRRTINYLKKAIKKEKENALQGIDANELNLYHVSVPDEGTTVNIANVESKESLTRGSIKLSNLFGTSPLPEETIHIFVQQLLEGNMNDPSALNKLRYVLVTSFGSEFPLRRREETLHVLWGGNPCRKGVFGRFKNRSNDDKSLHPIPFLACGPGTGKSRFLQFLGGVLREMANSCGDQSVESAFSNMVSINITYGSDTAASQFDVKTGGEASIAVRLLYEYFINTKDSGIKPKVDFDSFLQKGGVEQLDLYAVIQVIQSDIISRGTSTNDFSVLVIGIDEVDQLYKVCPNTLQEAVRAIGALSCSMAKPFCIPIMADGKVLHLTEDYLKNDILFRRSIADIGGVPKAVELFYHLFVDRLKSIKEVSDQAEDLLECLRNVNIVAIMQGLADRLSKLYPFQGYVELMTPVLAKAIFDIPVVMYCIIGDGTTITYENLMTTGVIHLEQAKERDMYHVRVPYLWLVILVDASKKCQSKSPLKNFLKVAEFDPEFPEFEVEIPDHRSVTVHQLLETFPDHEAAKDVDGMEHTNFLREFHKVFVNGKGAPADGFTQLRLQDRGGRGDTVPLCLFCQMKWTEGEDSKEHSVIDQTTIDEEITKIAKVNEVLKERCQSLECAFGIFSNRCESSSKVELHSHTFMRLPDLNTISSMFLELGRKSVKKS